MAAGGSDSFHFVAEEQIQLLLRAGFTRTQCINYLDSDMTKGEEARGDWQHRK
jgi:hypothetical protein